MRGVVQEQIFFMSDDMKSATERPASLSQHLSQFLGTVISESGCEASVELKKGAVARVDMRRSSGTLQWCLTPKALRTFYTAAVESSRPKTSRK